MRRLVSVTVILGAALAAAWWGLHFVPADLAYEVEAEFTALPANDGPLEDWLRNRPGVYLAHVQRQPVRGSWRLVVVFGMTRNGWGRPPLPDLEGKCAELGYRGQKGRFRDSNPR
jgi:hypothetical protein